MSIQLTASDSHILECFPVLAQLRPHLKQENFLEQVQRQQQGGYQLAFLERDDRVVAVAGFCISECLAWGRFLYVYDLVVDEAERSEGCGQNLFEWLMNFARNHDCQQLHLDSGVQRFDAHRFYLRQRMNIASHHFSLNL
ncbi:GNAT family N-acetyltransferase [Chamaesiphon polymorphus]|uniref:GNAT family N-acetyltransferase n=1 Tax=Chamaesiphon polymorphus CCALA 037 TaxID=2107692 RepID=A0A2T1GI61_9CYAN|nr:GNAT family N-acetyltransferase [Chamaesiphon polymorphus]PSB57397.1 GNAT family N-acetyltransferase [Chamaesiphon polymorphus CCALA 037]